MSDNFAASAHRIAGAAGRLLSWPPDWFWHATPAELTAILGADEQQTPGGITRETLETMMERERNG